MNKILFQIFSSHGKISSKRVFGGIGFIWSMILISLGMYDATVLTALGISASMIGLETIATFFNKDKTIYPTVDYTDNNTPKRRKTSKKELLTDSTTDVPPTNNFDDVAI
jgi:TfoX/Sxy family transcriptional regulator of competence genes